MYNFILVYEIELVLEVIMYAPLAIRLTNESFYTYKSTSNMHTLASIGIGSWGLTFVHSEKLY